MERRYISTPGRHTSVGLEMCRRENTGVPYITMESERMPEEWRDSVLIPIFKNKGDVQSCNYDRDINLISHTMKLWERVVEGKLRSALMFSEQQYGLMSVKSTTDALFAFRVLMEKYREGQKERVFVDL